MAILTAQGSAHQMDPTSLRLRTMFTITTILLLNFFLFSTIFAVQISTMACTPFLSVASGAYHGQIDYVRRGLPTSTTRAQLIHFLNRALNHSHQTSLGPCVSDSWLQRHQFKNGSLVDTVSLENELSLNETRVALLDHTSFPGDTSSDSAEMEWNRTKKLLATIRNLVEDSHVIFPTELSIRCDPWTDDACEQLRPSNCTLPSANLTAAVLAAAAGAAKSSAGKDRAQQMVMFFISHVFLSVRCSKTAIISGDEMISLFGRAVGRMGKAQGVSAADLRRCMHAELEVLTSYQSVGGMPEVMFDRKGVRRFTMPVDVGWGSEHRQSFEECLARESGELDVGMREKGCDEGFLYVEQEKGEERNQGQCCSELCVRSAETLGKVAGMFLDECCKECNMQNCTGSEKTGEEKVYQVDLPPYGFAEKVARRIMI